MIRTTFSILILMTLLSIPAMSAKKAPKPEVWMTHWTPELLGEPDAKWDFVKHNLDGIDIYINSVIWLTPQQLERLVQTLKTNQIQLGIECGLFDWDNDGPHDWTVPKDKIVQDVVRTKFDGKVGEETANIELGKLQKLFDAGGVPDYLNLDDSIRRLMFPGQDLSKPDLKGLPSVDRAVDELISYMKVWRKRFPKIEFFALANFPNWGWKGDTAYWGTGMMNGDYFEALKKIISKTKKAGIPIKGLTADCPYEYFSATRPHTPWITYAAQITPKRERDPAKVDWSARLLDLSKYVRSRGLEFNLVVNSETGGISAEGFCTGTLKYLDTYRAKKGTANRYIIQTWYKHPEKILPESEPHTMTWLTAEVIRKVK